MGIRVRLAAGILAALGLAASLAAAEPIKAKIDTGILVGDLDGPLASFKGAPFARPPIGALRWSPPAPAEPWSGERAALAYGPSCPQPMHKDGSPNDGGASGPISEDCLTLNVFAPRGARQAPVMVWIYGGGNVVGSSSVSSYDGAAFARDGVVLVTVNYRLGALGFFAHPLLTKAAAADAPLGDYALMDQIAALKWVQRNIGAFGGDPSNVTIFGESAGGVDTLALMSIPSARPLFAKAIVESGGGWGPRVSLSAAETIGSGLAAKAGLTPDATLEQLRSLPMDTVVSMAGRYGPIVDGRLLPLSPTETFAAGKEAKVPLIIGSNSFEASLMAGTHMPPETFLAAQPPALLKAYDDEPTSQAKAYALFTDGVMGAGARWVAAKQSALAPAWLYYFSFRRAVYKDLVPGAPHASEIPFVFDSWAKIDPKLSRGTETPEDKTLTEVMHACWMTFARSGTPNCMTPQPWPSYSPSRDQLMEFGPTVGVLTHFRKTQLDAQETAKAALLTSH